jgi:ABC-2 type transport system ATP-binding protein
MIQVRNLNRVYNGIAAVDIPSLEIAPGESFGLVGNNGAGKTTFFRLALDLVLPEQGVVLSKGVDVRTTDAWKRYTGSYLDEGFLIDYLTPEGTSSSWAACTRCPEPVRHLVRGP